MRTKSFVVRSSRKSLDPYPSPASLPDEANERYGSGVNTTHCDSGDADVEIVPDTYDERDVPHKKRHCLGTSDTGKGGSQPLNLDACIVCDVSDKWVSRCSGIDCLLSFHGKCLNAELGSSSGDDLACSYCPYCWFKIIAQKHKLVREKVVAAEKAVFTHLGKEMESRDEVKESAPKSREDAVLSGGENGRQDHSVDSTDVVSDQELQGEKDACASKEERMQVEKDSDKSRGEKMPLIEETDLPEEDKEMLEARTDNSGDMVEASEDEERVDTEKIQDAEDDKDVETAKDQTKVNAGARGKGDVSPFVSMQESFSGKEQDQVQQNERPRRRRRLILNTIDSDISSNESTNERNGDDVTEQITSSAQVVTSPSGKMKNQQRKLNATAKVAKSKTVRDISFFKKDQRRRLFWTSEEEEMLKVGVERFAAEANKNMPWRKILEMGETVFHETRTPSDLKDKWRNMTGRARQNKIEN
ncbi:unnamed protein product [Thlaspi arvense]|uniref:Myb-like domain-containing protein n=1 Tax=Thlaspi arvense TaxID=13288 RepID=A0AAU9RNG4_THLAR|nr:unnamed protein product [Thlaspi arvense]